jgi:hypothetical protein
MVNWRKSARSAELDCVEAGQGQGVIGVRDTTDKGQGLVLRFRPASWARFTASLKGL